MASSTKPTVFFLLDPSRAGKGADKLEGLLRRLADLTVIDVTGKMCLPEELASACGRKTIFIDSGWAGARGANSVVVDTGGEPSQSRGGASFLKMNELPNTELPRLIHLILSPERCPGVAVLSDRGSQIFYEKVHSLSEIGQKVDRIVLLLEKRHPDLANQIFNLRQLSYALLHQGFLASREASRVLPVVDFQCSANPDRFTFAARFKAPAGRFAEWRQAAADGTSQLWRSARESAEALILTELTARQEIEFKALVSRHGGFSAGAIRSLLTASISDFRQEAAADENARAANMLPLESLSAESKGPGSARDNSTAGGALTELVPEAAGERLSLKLRAEVLEKEKLGLQELVKKKTLLLSGLQRDVSRAQADLLNAQSIHSRELQKVKASEEKVKSDFKEVSDKLQKLQKLQEQTNDKPRLPTPPEASTPSETPQEAQPDFEKQFRQSEYSKRLVDEKSADQAAKIAHQEKQLERLREDLRIAAADAAEQRTAARNAEKMVLAKDQEMKRLSGEAPKAPGAAVTEDGAASKLKEAQRLYYESHANEQKLEKEVKALTAKQESIERNMKTVIQKQQHELDLAKKAAEEAKRQKSEAMNKLEEATAAAKAKLQESNESERQLKRKVELLAAELAQVRKNGKAA